MIRALFAYLFLFTAGLASAAAYFYSIHPEHQPEDDFPRMRLDLEDALQRARRARDAFEAPPPETTQAHKVEPVAPPPLPKKPAPKSQASVGNSAKRK